MDNFIALFGPTRESTHFTYGTGVNNLVSTTAFFIDAGDAGSRYAAISSDYTRLGNEIVYRAAVIGDNGQFDISSTHTLFGVALYRNAETIASANTVTVPAPSTFAIFALGMIGLASRRFKKKS
ncbi:PEP-CTERM sorting domain-containing protein [Psychromonas sp. SP041]|uniref:PEP-CTERM sorting domain-containing protein n=1 Tax=Psychromonas sp. SP041 TaxID=1365007 RepID=UPI000415AE0C|nr:PEP-CTERM sorting domain-containing protein [Psychromonas sp. SP041]